jgi:LGFP repeat
VVERVNFDDFPAGTSVTTQYAARGVLFDGEHIALAQGAPSGTNVLRADDPISEFDRATSIRMRFTSTLTRIRVRAGVVSGSARSATLRAFDANDNLLASDGPRNVTGQFATVFNLSVASAAIRWAELDMDGPGAAIDDLGLDGDAPVPLPTTPPTIQVTSPAANLVIGADLGFVAHVHITGRVDGESLMPTIRLTIHRSALPGAQVTDDIVDLPLAGSGVNRTFSVDPEVTLGPHTFTLTATNIAGLTASAEVHVTYLPDAIRLRFEHDGGTATFGNFLAGGVEGDRYIAIYDHGAISLRGSTTVTVLSLIFSKWMSVRDPGAFPRLGAPVTEQRTLPAGGTAQDFSDGRIYVSLQGGPHYVSSVFVDAIDRLGGENLMGVPISDPTHFDALTLPDAMQTWQFQQFIRLDHSYLLPSTIELRGSPPRLYVERQGGYVYELTLAGVPAQELEQELFVADAPTIWYSFSCEDSDGPCTVAVPTSGPPIQNAGARYCDGTTYPFGPPPYPAGPPQWSAIRGQYLATPIMGIVQASHPADSDNPLTHEHYGDPPFFPSDWRLYLYPLNPYRSLLRSGQQTLELEFEEYFARHFFVGQNGQPTLGNLVFATGRWIIDCGHDNYNAEIHPPFVLARMHTVTFQGTEATEANIWVNGFFPGDPVEFDIYPPPRPSANATLSLQKPVDQDAAIDVTVAFDIAAAEDHVHVRFTASSRHVPVTGMGEMKWQAGRAYEGTWHVYWDVPPPQRPQVTEVTGRNVGIRRP